MTTGIFSSRLVTSGAIILGLLVSQQQAFASDGAGKFRDFVALNPGIDRSALRQMWNNKADGPGGIGFGVIMPGAHRVPEVAPIVRVAPPVMVPGNVETFKQFRAQNPGVDGNVLRQVWNCNDLSRSEFIPNRSKPISNHDVRNNVISYGQFKDLNAGIDNRTLRQMYQHLKNGDPADVTIGVISFPPTAGSGHEGPTLSRSGSILADQNAFGSVNLLTSDK